MRNKYKVSKKQWNKWSEEGKKIFNDVYTFQKGVVLPNSFNKLSSKEWQTIRWNFAFMTACMFPKSKMDLNDKLFKCNDAKLDKTFLNRLSELIFKFTGNVNVTIRLKGIAGHTHTYCGYKGNL